VSGETFQELKTLDLG
jgi:Leucine-rich repeat (LRR) protein